MSELDSQSVSRLASLMFRLARLRADQHGNVAIMAGLLMVPLIGSMAVAFEVSNWYMTKRAMQNAADAAVLAAATNGGSNYATEAKAVTANYGFTDGSNNVTVAVSNAASCPGGGTTCYSVTITDIVPLYLSQVVGFLGDATLGSAKAKSLTSTAVATQAQLPTNYCLLALATSGTGIRTNGSPKANMTGCDVMSDSGATCNGSNLLATIGAAHGTNNGCGIQQYSDVSSVSDPYSGKASNIPTNPCKPSDYSWEPTSKKGAPLASSNQWSSSQNLSGNVIVCGDLQLTGNVTINAPSGAVLVIENGQLDTNGFTLSTASGSALTIVFSGDNSGSYTHAPTGGGTLDFAAPTSGTWSGVAIYQDPKITNGVDISAAGNTPTWDITGLVYLPNANVTFSGAVNKSSYGQSCFVMVVNTVLINGTASILETGGCDAAGLPMPANTIPGRAQLVL